MKELKINNDDCFCKIINPSEVHWAFIQPKKSNTGEYIIKFVDSKSNVFDEIKFPSWWSAKCDVKKNGFEYDFVYPHMGIEKPKKHIAINLVKARFTRQAKIGCFLLI